MQPAVFSQYMDDKQKSGWLRNMCQDVKYYKNNISKDYKKSYYSLSFSYEFQNSQDKVYFCYGFPYTFSDLNKYLSKMMLSHSNNLIPNLHIKQRTLCYTLAGNPLNCYTITSSTANNIGKRYGIVFMARQHPGENTGSFMIEGVLDFLNSNKKEAQFLREFCVFKVIPMINVDGVIHGNNRCSLSGVDLNRRWQNPDKDIHPEVYYTKHMIQKFNQTHPIKLIVDFHGHSRKKQAFFYGNNMQGSVEQTKIFPYICSQIQETKNFMSYEYSKFKTDPCFESTARMALWKLLNIPNIYTLEASFFGYSKQQNESIDKGLNDSNSQNNYEICNFLPKDYKNIGNSVCLTLYSIVFQEYKDSKFTSIQEEKQQKLNQDNNNQLKDLQQNSINQENSFNYDDAVKNFYKEKGFNDIEGNILSGSDSDPEGDQLDEKFRKQLLSKNFLKVKRQKKKKTEKQRKISKNKYDKKVKQVTDDEIQALKTTSYNDFTEEFSHRQLKVNTRDLIKNIDNLMGLKEDQENENQDKKQQIKQNAENLLKEIENSKKKSLQKPVKINNLYPKVSEFMLENCSKNKQNVHNNSNSNNLQKNICIQTNLENDLEYIQLQKENQILEQKNNENQKQQQSLLYGYSAILKNKIKSD